MIRRIQDEKQLLPWEGDPLGVRACAAAASYGIDGHVCQFWLQNEDTLLCRIDDSMVLCSGARADWDELAGFLPLSGARVVLCRREEAERLGFPVRTSGWVMLGEAGKDDGAPFCEVEENPSLRELYALLTQCETESFHAPEFEAFYLDMSHRTRHGEALSVDGTGVSVSYDAENDMLIDDEGYVLYRSERPDVDSLQAGGVDSWEDSYYEETVNAEDFYGC